MKRLKFSLCVLGVFAFALWLNNTSLLIDVDHDRAPHLIAHRGVHHIYKGSDRTSETCRAADLEPITHGYIENTLPSMQAAFESGADVVEIDVHPTTDGALAVFHDWTLDCQTDGTGRTRDQSLNDLRALDLGYGLTADGITFPLRGKARGQLSSLEEVLKADLGPRYLVNFKSNTAQDADRLSDLMQNPDFRNQIFGAYGGAPPTRTAMQAIPGLKGLDKPALITCLQRYMLVGWTGFVPKACANRLIGVPLDFAPYVWGWPHRFTKRITAANSHVILWGPYDSTGFSSGIDDLETLARVPAGFDGYVWTNRIEMIGPDIKPINAGKTRAADPLD